MKRFGLTFVELTVSLVVIALLVGILLPAFQWVRESARNTGCRNQLRQLSLSIRQFQSALGHFPSNGWGFRWHGDPDQGVGRLQPGGWPYQILGYLEENRFKPSRIRSPCIGYCRQWCEGNLRRASSKRGRKRQLISLMLRLRMTRMIGTLGDRPPRYCPTFRLALSGQEAFGQRHRDS